MCNRLILSIEPTQIVNRADSSDESSRLTDRFERLLHAENLIFQLITWRLQKNAVSLCLITKKLRIGMKQEV